MKFSDYLIGNQGGEQMSSQTPIQPQQMQSIAPQQSMQSSVTDFGIKPNQSAPKKKAETFDVLGMLEKTNQFTQQAIKDNPVSKGNTVYTGRNKNIREIQEGIEQSTKETHKLNTLLDMKRYIDDGATLEEFQADFGDVPQEILPQIYEEFAYGTKMKDILKLYPELDNIQPPQQLREKYDIKKFFNPLGEAGKTILKAKEKAKEDGSFLTSNPLTQGFMGAVGGAVKSVGDLGAGIVGISDKINSLGKSITEGGDIDQYSERPSSLSEDVFNTVSGGVGTVGSVFAMPASILINTGIEALPRDYQVALSDSMDWLGDKIAQTPGLKQWMESLPVERQNEFKQELANAGFGLLIGLKGKKNIITDPKLFLKENINPISIARNFNENVMGIPSKALDTAVSTVGKMKIPEVNIPSVKVPKAVSNKVDMVIEQLEGVGKAKKEGIQNNPYSKEIYSKVIDDIDNGNAPQNYKDMQEPYTKKVVEELDTILDDVKSQKGEGGEAFNLLRQDQTPIDTTVEIKSMNDLLKGTDYSLKTFLNRVDKGNLLGTRKILDNTATISTLHDIRKGLDDLMLKAQANKDSGEFKILKDMRKIVDGKLKENPDRVKADEEWSRISKDIQEIEEGITYREQRKKGQIRDNIDSIIENINNPAKAKLRERLLQYMPDIGERISAIRGIPEIAKAYTTIPQGVIGRTAGALGGVAIGSIGGIPGMILGGIAGMFADAGLSQLRRNAIKKAIAKQSPKAIEKLGEIQKSIADGKKLRAEQVIELQNFTNNLKKSLPANDKELISKVSELPKVMKTSLVPVKEGVLGERVSKNILEERDKYISSDKLLKEANK